MSYPFACILAAAAFMPALGKDAPSLIAQLCRDQTCDNAKFPIIDYDEQTQKCMCSAHPCWDADGQEHSCEKDSGFPYLTYSYNEQGELQCSCSATPHYMSTYIG